MLKGCCCPYGWQNKQAPEWKWLCDISQPRGGQRWRPTLRGGVTHQECQVGLIHHPVGAEYEHFSCSAVGVHLQEQECVKQVWWSDSLAVTRNQLHLLPGDVTMTSLSGLHFM